MLDENGELQTLIKLFDKFKTEKEARKMEEFLEEMWLVMFGNHHVEFFFTIEEIKEFKK